MKPVVYDLYCGLGGWAEGFLAEGYRVVGFDIERHDYGTGGYPGELVLQDIRTLHGAQLDDAAVIVASSPCQEFSYRAMPWKRAKALGPPVLGIDLFYQSIRIQHEAQEASGRPIPLIMENVKGAQKWIGRAGWHYGSFYLWGDVPALMPRSSSHKVPGFNFHQHEKTGRSGGSFQSAAVEGLKNTGGSWFKIAHNTNSGLSNNPVREREEETAGRKGTGGTWFTHLNSPDTRGRAHWKDGACVTRRFSSRSVARKAASAQIAKIPFPLAQHIAKVFKPESAAISREVPA